MNNWSIGKRISYATAAAGLLDIGMAAITANAKGRAVAEMLRSVASGPFPGASKWGDLGSVVGLVVHFAIMGVMAAVFMFVRERSSWLRAHSLVGGAIYGVILWLVMYGLVLPLRFGAPFPSPNPVEILLQLFAHVVLVGLTIGWVSKR
ncbi:hypothetical protein [Sphingomonas sp.]|uniref:hypothetical protein n=1 Tax=Sphingomonas sp. TaxID=28214 RepID=UPI001B225E5B|nr:hypothetical protein [Sphingomonas sp.]MBO9711310.1 hypothetical protein [Sphingomonas sp.]